MESMKEITIAVQDLATSCQRAVMLLRAFEIPSGEIDDLQAAIDRYYKLRTAERKAHHPTIEPEFPDDGMYGYARITYNKERVKEILSMKAKGGQHYE